MKIKSFPIFTLFLVLIFSADAFAQFRDESKLAVLTRPRVSANEKKAPGVFDLEKLAFRLINKERAANGLKELEWSEDAAKVARLHSQNMADFKFFNHKGLDGLMVDDRAVSLGVKRWQAIGENIAFNRGYDNPTEFAVECWMKSNGHRQNILRESWQETGVGVAVTADESFYFTQIFILRK